MPIKRRFPWNWVAVTLFLLWLFFSLGSYYVVQKPFTLPQLIWLTENSFLWQPVHWSAAAFGRTLVDLLTGLWLLLVAGGCGRWLLHRFALTSLSLLAEAVLSLGLGWGAIGIAILILGSLHLYQPAIFIGLAIVLTVLAIPQLLAFSRTIPRPIHLPSTLITFYLSLVVFLALTLALLPPTSWDGLFYHLTGPKLYLATGGIVGGIDIPHLSFPSLLQMNFLLAMALRGDTVAHLIHFSFVFLLMGVVTLLAREWLHLATGRVAVLLLLTMPMFLTLATWAYNDLALAFYSAAAFYLFGHWLWQTGRASRQPLMLAGIMAGFAMGMKYTSLIVPIILILFILKQDWRDWRAGLAFAVPAGLMVLPWLLKNWLLTGNPVYPFVFGGQFWNEHRAAAYAEAGTGIGLNPWAILRAPYDLTLGLRDASQDGLTGPLFLACLPLLLVFSLTHLRQQAPPGFRYLLLAAFGHYLFWLMGVISSQALWQSRLLLPAFVLLCPALAWVWQAARQWDHPEFSLGRFLNIALGLVLFLGLMNQFLLWLPQVPWAYLVGSETRPLHLQRRLGDHYAAMQYLNTHLPETAVILFLWEPRSYYCDRDCRPDTILDRLGDLEYQYGDGNGIAAAWSKQGITHVLLWRTALQFILEQRVETGLYSVNQPLLTELLTTHLQPIDQFAGYELYALSPP
ncbi:MAG: glycosyltransferase family 39 protein [Anaerolineae bacterium]|nr:glycosyltransferase family 39 protein [Anaerolineae bacterium]